tara:strand:+ start:31 stop:177 length:147 start_codon:yes stop_codon:yes gene_type:complete
MNPSETGVVRSLSSEFDVLPLVSVTDVFVVIIPAPMPIAIETTGKGML